MRASLRSAVPRRLILAVLIVGVALSPRIPLPIVLPDRRFDLRLEDLWLVVVTVLLACRALLGRRLDPTPLARTLMCYVLIVAFTTALSAISVVAPARAALYLLKETQYFLLFVVVANWVETEQDIIAAMRLLLGAGLVNLAWVAAQVISGMKGPALIVASSSPVIYENPALLESYGPTLIAEASPLATGGFFLGVFALTLARGLLLEKRRLLYLVLSVACVIAIALSFSRASLVGAGGLVLALGSGASMRRRLLVGAVVVVAVLVVGELVGQFYSDPGLAGRLRVAEARNSLLERQDTIWRPLTAQAVGSLLIGSGKGALGVTEGLEASEAHNHYLRVILESGIFGLGAFLILLCRIMLMCARVRRQTVSRSFQVLGAASFAMTVGLAAAALFQDVFAPVVLNETWWLLLGLVAAAERIMIRRSAPVAAGEKPVHRRLVRQ